MTPEQAKEYFYNLHDVECNQKYNKNLPYSFHLEMVVHMANRFKHCIPNRYNKATPENQYSNTLIWDEIIIGCLGHDSIEDARITYNDLKDKFGDRIADIIYCCTEEKGRNRDERHSEKYYTELANNDIAIFVKLCDICANVTFSLLSNSSMFSKHKKEHESTKKYLYKEQYQPIFDYLNNIFKIN